MEYEDQNIRRNPAGVVGNHFVTSSVAKKTYSSISVKDSILVITAITYKKYDHKFKQHNNWHYFHAVEVI